MSNNRSPRANETRVEQERPRMWKPPSRSGTLTELRNDPDFVYRFINTSVLKETDIVDRAIIKKGDEGWVPVNASDNPLFTKGAYALMVRADGTIQRTGQKLYRMPREFGVQRNNYWINEDRKRRSVRLESPSSGSEGIRDDMANTGQETLSREVFVGQQTANV